MDKLLHKDTTHLHKERPKFFLVCLMDQPSLEKDSARAAVATDPQTAMNLVYDNTVRGLSRKVQEELHGCG